MIPLFKPYISKTAGKLVADTLNSGYIGEGPRVKELENKLSTILNGYVVLVNSGTSALHLAYQMADIRGYEVITTPMTCMATNTPIVHNGGRIIWADIDPDTGNIDINSIREKITDRTKAIVCVHYGGNLCDPELSSFYNRHNITLIEDCAHLVANGLGGIECYSFQAIKFLTTGDGGALVTKSKSLYERAKLLRWYGIDRENGSDMRCMKPIYEVGHKFHMNDISASIGLANFEDLSDIVVKTHTNADRYNKAFSNLNHIHTIPVAIRNDYWLYILLVDNRDGFMKYMKDNEISVSLVHARNDTQPIFHEFKCPLPNLDIFWEKQVCIPVGWWLENKDIDYIIDKVYEYDKICSN